MASVELINSLLFTSKNSAYLIQQYFAGMMSPFIKKTKLMK